MKKRLLFILLPLAYLAFFGVLIDNQQAPEVLNSGAIQFVLGAIVAVTCPVCILLSVSLALGERRLMALLWVALSAFPLVLAQTMYFVLPDTGWDIEHDVLRSPLIEINEIVLCTARAQDPNVAVDERMASAQELYREWGITPVILDSAHVLTKFSPSPIDRSIRQSNLGLRERQGTSRSYFHQTWVKFGNLSAYDLLAFILIIGGGLTVFVMRRPSLPPDRLRKDTAASPPGEQSALPL